MSQTFPANKDNIIDDMDDAYGLSLSDEEYARLRKLTESELLLVTILLSRAVKHIEKEIEQ